MALLEAQLAQNIPRATREHVLQPLHRILASADTQRLLRQQQSLLSEQDERRRQRQLQPVAASIERHLLPDGRHAKIVRLPKSSGPLVGGGRGGVRLVFHHTAPTNIY